LCELPPQRVGRNEVDERLLAVDLDDGDQLPVARLELRITVDRHFFELEPDLLAERRDSLPRALAEVAARGRVEANYGYSPRVVVASATR
jgi:hypothetical protein